VEIRDRRGELISAMREVRDARAATAAATRRRGAQ